ncbi:MAG TPA: hypothetical protein DIW50_05680 [Prolixibacteraceae bacterium]|nr:hypothetical protein [Prolixibacteraceae bacterium]
MAKVGNNIVTTGLSGKLGDLIVFRNRGGKTIVSKTPRKKEQEPSEAQEQHQLRFQEAILYGKTSIADPRRKAVYNASAEEGKSAFNVAVADCLNAPQIREIDLSHYTGQPDSYIRVHATDDFQVVEVTVTILNADGSEVESGYATTEPGTGWWRYTATALNESLDGDKIIIRASELPGNLTQKDQQF